MSAKRTAIFNQGRGKQHGAVLMIMLMIMIVGIAAILVNSLSSATLKNARQKNTAAALAQAKDALIGFAITYRDTHTISPQVNGYLPCPDIAGGLTEGTAELSCGLQDVSVIGRLPWATLDLSILRDGDGECLWYAVSGTYKDNPKTGLMNWDTNGQFQAYAPDGTTLLSNQVVAVIFAPGAPQSGQDRSDTTAPVCGGNYTATSYLDKDTGHSNIDNSDVATGKFIQGTSGGTVNDQMLFITQQDIWNAIKKHNDFGTFVTNLLQPSTAYLPTTVDFSTTPTTENTYATPGSPGCLRISRVRKGYIYSNDWQDNVLYARPKSGSCTITVNGAPCGLGVVIFPGERNTGQTRITNTDKNTWSNYLEGANLTAFTTGGTSFSGATSYSAASPSTDVLACE
jgi:hypothetical protein